MKTFPKLSFIMLFLLGLASCAHKDKVIDNVCRGIYEESNRMQQMQRNEDPAPPKDEPLSYDEYKKEREKMLNGDDADQKNP